MMHYLGVDWAVEKHDLCLLADDGRVLSQFSIVNDSTGFQQLGEVLEGLAEVSINIERPDGLLVDWLAAQEYPVYVTSPTVVARRRPRRSKDDRGDAYLLADLLRGQDTDCRPLIRQSCTVIHLRQLIKAYDDAVRGQRRETNRLVWALRKYYPTVLHAFRCHYSQAFTTFLEAFPTPQAARALNQVELVQFLKQLRYPIGNRLNHIYNALQVPTPPAYAQEGYVEAMLMILPHLRCLAEQRNHLRKRIVQVFKTHPEAAWWCGFPGTSGPLTPARLLAAIGDNRQRFPSAQVLQAIAGTVPVTRRSGKQTWIEFRTACSKPLRKASDDLARQSVKYSGWAQAYFYDQLGRGHDKSRAYRALGNRWLAIIWKLWQTGETYDEATHVANRSRRGQPLPA
jgi:transposase